MLTSSYLSPRELSVHENTFKIAFAHSITLPMLSGNALISVLPHYTPIQISEDNLIMAMVFVYCIVTLHSNMHLGACKTEPHPQPFC